MTQTKSFNVPANVFAAVAHAVPTEEARYYLNGVHIEPGCIVATNGHVMTAARVETPDNAGWIVPASKKSITAAKARKADRVTWDGEVLRVLDANGAVTHMEPAPEIDGTFPNWRQIMPRGQAGPTSASFGTAVLRTLIDTAKVVTGEKHSAITILGEGDDWPHIVTYQSEEDVFSIAMPWRMDKDAQEPRFGTPPAWALPSVNKGEDK